MIEHIFTKIYTMALDVLLSHKFKDERYRAMGQARFRQDYYKLYSGSQIYHRGVMF